MPIPTTNEIKKPLLARLQEVREAKISELYNFLSSYFKLSAEELTKLYPSGNDYIFKNRVRWARQHLINEGAAVSPSYGMLALTKQENPISIAESEVVSPVARTLTVEINPEEEIENSFSLIEAQLNQELLVCVKQQTWQFFEKLVIDLLLKMGYGSSRKEAGTAFQTSNDQGIDGIINEDPLGLDIIYVQAKKWENTVGRQEVQGFLGALSTKRASKGVFITTSYFNNNAIECAKQSDKKIVLIDGPRLASLMIEYGLAVTIFKTYQIKRVDSTYFNLD